jgi:site-specific recombinase XerD
MEENCSKNSNELVGQVVRIFLKKQTWWANYQFRGRQKRTSLRTTNKKEARRRAVLLEADVLRGHDQSEGKSTPIDVAIESYRSYLKAERRAKKTVVKYNKVLDRVQDLAVRTGRRTMARIDLQFIDAFRKERTESGAAAKTVYNETVIIRQLVNFARTRRLITTDPLAGLRLREPKPTPQPCWTAEEVDRILQEAGSAHALAFTLLADTGFRVGELKHLTWDDVDFAHNVLHVREKDDWKPKTGDQRAVPMTPRVRSSLEGLTQRSRWVVTAPPSAKYPTGDHQVSERRLLVALKRVLKQLGWRGHLHTFRHAFISRALTNGIAEAVVRAWVGHVDADVIRLYTHIADADSQAAMRRLNPLTNA